MVPALGYADLSMDRADCVLSENGELLVFLPEKHGLACVAFIETVRTVQKWPANCTPFVARLWPLLKSFGVILRVLIGHAKLFELSRVIVLNSSAQTWERRPDGTFLFKFVRKPGAV
jgi:hypothetical protein